MIATLSAAERFRTELDWLDSRHSFSFGEHYDPQRLGFRALRVINDDRVQPGGGFGTHPHRDMEILSWVLEGALQHRDSLGTGSVIRPGDIQRMSAGTGVLHSEWNASDRELVRFLQIWIVPERRGLPPSYEQKTLALDARAGALVLAASPDGRDGSVTVHQDVRLWLGRLAAGTTAAHDLDPGRHAWVQVARGEVGLDGARLREGDGAAVSDQRRLTLRTEADAEVLLFDLA